MSHTLLKKLLEDSTKMTKQTEKGKKDMDWRKQDTELRTEAEVTGIKQAL